MSSFQHTLAKSASISGSSLHTGEKTTLTLHPAPPGHGRKFKRKDLADEPTIDASIDNLKNVERSTTIAEGSVKVHTVEHVLSALAGLGVDNALIEMDANEPPIGDGSALPYLELIKKRHRRATRAARGIRDHRAHLHRDEKWLAHDHRPGFRLSRVLHAGRSRGALHAVLFHRDHAGDLRKGNRARADFCFLRRRETAHGQRTDQGRQLGKRGCRPRRIRLEQGAAAFPRRVCAAQDSRHRRRPRALFPPLKGHVIAVKPGHGPNTELARAVAKQFAKTMALVPPSTTPKGGDILDVNDVMKLLPHRYPFLMVDRIVNLDGEVKCPGSSR